ncbi:apolipoprotein N-acyltransferase [Desulfosudis oleivorans]|uniref:Apolipoprotein N-acyltransferase n=1 Tax=Desulfosudis oleivorans (strain DSM 6200 / JCM 39069 / Hxd3) TaxID=96561 RepID=A8ZT04_DESOH|nr:apolipoprotein N-acyltransferase [Desulfosudis oleivorans]ABW66168.1 apolipoprotein N-acyltransferase [Desulfosudis oleivorans Hxd3]
MVLASLSGILFTVAFSVKPLWWVSFAALFPLLLSLDRARTWRAAAVRMSLFSIVFSFGMGYWVFHALVGHYQLPAGTAVSFFILALVLPVWLMHLTIALFYRFLNNRTPVFYALVVPCLWVLGDYVKGMIPLLVPWGDIGYALVDWGAYFQMADLGGVYLVSFLVVMFNSLLVCLMECRPQTNDLFRRRPMKGRAGTAVLILLVLILLVPLCYGSVRRYRMPVLSLAGEKTPAVIAQGNFSHKDRWGGLGFYQRLKTYIELSGDPSDMGKAGVIVWPETVLNHPEALTGPFFADLARILGKENLLIAGGLKRDSQSQGVYNSVYVIEDGQLKRYDKHILLPYSERGPAVGPLFRFYNAPDRFIPGTTPACLSTSHGRVGLSVCFEILYPGYVRLSVKQGAEFLVNVSNDAWFGDSAMPRAHLRAARARAVETGRWLLRASNSGISAVIAPNGSLTAGSDLFRTQRISGSFTRLTTTTVYTRWGEWLFFFCLAVPAISLLRAGVRR